MITEQQFDGVRLGDDKSDVIGVLGGRGEPGSPVSGVVDFEDIRLEEDRRYQRTASVMTSGGKR